MPDIRHVSQVPDAFFEAQKMKSSSKLLKFLEVLYTLKKFLDRFFNRIALRWFNRKHKYQNVRIFSIFKSTKSTMCIFVAQTGFHHKDIAQLLLKTQWRSPGTKEISTIATKRL